MVGIAFEQKLREVELLGRCCDVLGGVVVVCHVVSSKSMLCGVI
jgi:hypothetical protein